ncbi:hypothetical protein, partial [uncultured Mameliella sp.]|uniref:hypothetical protein n=1 Tax=uncultured Mameliella sp. TaxID=1447087 RepID=UPI00261C0C63
ENHPWPSKRSPPKMSNTPEPDRCKSTEASAKDLTALETRSTGRIERELAGLKDCVTLLIRSQAASMKALSGLLNDEANYKTLDENLQQSLTLAKAAAERLRDS